MSQTKSLRFLSQKAIWLTVVAMTFSTLIVSLVRTTGVEAGQIDERSVDISTSESGATDVIYSVSFDVATTADLDSIVIQYCDDSPIIGDVGCADARSFDWVDGALTVNNFTGATGTWAVDAAASDNTLLVIDRTAATGNVNAGTTISFDLGSGSTDGVTNPTGDNSAFYLRILTYTDESVAALYAPGTPGAYTDAGGVALSTAEQIDIEARVQERLTFCVGTTDPGLSCSGISGSSTTLGILDGTINLASTEGSLIYAQVSTNAFYGATVQYIADHLQVGSGCADADALKTSGNDIKTDQCLNYEVDGTATPIAGSDEQWGLGVVATPDDGDTTDNLTPAAAYNSNGTTQFSFTPNTATTIASSSTVVDSEQLNIDLGATSSITTPTGVYTTTMTFIATATF